jgi:hypothetical protein
MTNKVTGRATITAGGLTLETESGSTCQPGGRKRTTVTSDQGVAGHTDEVSPARVECSIIHKAGMSIAAIEAMEDVTVSFVTDTNVVFTGTHMWCLGELKMSKGRISAVFEGPPMTELTGA